jgi:hypothetical protein
MAAWQYRWAALAGSEVERERRHGIGAYLERIASERGEHQESAEPQTSDETAP